MDGKQGPYCSSSSSGSLSYLGLQEKNGASLVAQIVKNLSVMQETQVLSLGQEDPLEEGMATHSNLGIPWTEKVGGWTVDGAAKS